MFYKLSKYIALVFLFGASPLFGNSTAPDPFFPMQWSLHNDGTQSIAIEFDKYNKPNQFGKPGVDIGWLESKEEIQTLGKNPVIVAILDTGLDTDPDSLHPDLQGRIHPAPWDFLYNSGNVVDADGHGTQIAGLIGANFDNGIGIAGITPNVVKLLPIRVSAEHTFNFYRFRNKLSSDYAADGLRYAIKNGATVVNMSLTWSKLADTENFRNALSEAIKAGVLVVADAGNESREHATFPCAYDGVLCVGAITNTGEKSIYSNYGGLIDVLAPGDNLISLFPLGLESQIFRTQGYDSFKHLPCYFNGRT
jgi:cell wall-associated protease